MVKPSCHRSAIITFHLQGISAREIHQRLGVHRSVIYRTIKRYRELGTEDDRSGRGRPATVVTTANLRRVRERIRRQPSQSAHKMSREMGINESSLRRIIRKLGLKAYKKNKCQKLTDAQKEKRKERSRELLRRFGNGRHLRILFTGEKLFTVEQVVNKQNDRAYAVSNPHATVGRSSHPDSVMVFAGITADGKTPLWFVPEGTKVNSQNYLELLKDKLLPWANSHFGSRFWTFQQDGAPAHRSTTVQQWCKENFPDVIAFNEWPACSPDLHPMDYSVWAVLEAEACSKPHRSVDSLKRALEKVWDKLSERYLRATVDAFPERLKACVEANGGIFEIH
uniref:DDE_3 domain-containing protein n=1 Tax=Haemonchus contortus TaxID=6289 RepID=A0A7I4Z8I3_HAECO|nr:transposase [Haemonchus contortus]